MNKSLDYYRCIIEPGHIGISIDPAVLCAVCGKSVVVIIWNRHKKIGGMAHCILPAGKLGGRPTNYHANTAISNLANHLLGLDPGYYNLEAQIFGGANLRGFEDDVALRTVKAAKKALKKFRIIVVSQDTGGNLGRKIVFDVRSGNTMLIKARNLRRNDWFPEPVTKNLAAGV